MIHTHCYATYLSGAPAVLTCQFVGSVFRCGYGGGALQPSFLQWYRSFCLNELNEARDCCVLKAWENIFMGQSPNNSWEMCGNEETCTSV